MVVFRARGNVFSRGTKRTRLSDDRKLLGRLMVYICIFQTDIKVILVSMQFSHVWVISSWRMKYLCRQPFKINLHFHSVLYAYLDVYKIW